MAVTERQEKMLENIGNGDNAYQAMRKAGYSDSYARNPKLLKKTKGWKELMDKDLPESLITTRLKELSQASVIEKTIFHENLTEKELRVILTKLRIPLTECSYIKVDKEGWVVYYTKPDFTNRNTAIEKIIKLRGRYTPNKIPVEDSTLIDKSDEELFAELEELNNSELIRYKNYKEGKAKREQQGKGE